MNDSIQAIYEEVCRNHHGISDFRAKLLAALPLSSGAAFLFSVWAGFTVQPGEFPPASPPNGLCFVDPTLGGLSPADCADQTYSTDSLTVRLPNFVRDVSPGPNEGGSVELSVLSIGGAFFGPVTLDGLNDLTFTLEQTPGATGTVIIRAEDDGGLQTDAQFNVTTSPN